MRSWQERVLSERVELCVRLGRLELALDGDHPVALNAPSERFWLTKQRNAMTEYLEALDARIALFAPSE